MKVTTGFLSDCRSLMLGIAIHCIQHSQAMLERGVCELAHSFFHFCCRKPLFEDRKNMLTDLYKYLLCPGNNDHFLSIMSIRKGRKLVARVLPLLEKVRLFVHVISLLINLTTSGKSKIICNQLTQKSYPSLQEKNKIICNQLPKKSHHYWKK